MSTFFYDEQIRRYLLQFIRVFADLKVQSTDSAGNTVLKRVPIRYGDASRIVEHTIRNNSENTLLPSPMMSAWIQNISMAPERRLDPSHVSQKSFTEQSYNNSEYTGEAGMQYSVTRMMPVPYNATFQLDIWTTNTTQKLQLWEQISVWFNPSIVLQQNQNPLDWTSIFEIKLIETIWSNRSIPTGPDSERDVCSFIFNVPLWISPPALLDRKKHIEQIVTSIFDTAGLTIDDIDTQLLDPVRSCFPELDQTVIAPGDYKTSIGIDSAPNELLLLNSHGIADPSLSWKTLLEEYGELEEGISRMLLKTNNNLDSEEGDIYGNISYHPTQDNILLFDIDTDTLPSTLPFSPVNKIIDPLSKYPGNGLPAAAAGQSYLLISDDNSDNIIPENTGTNPWGSLSARSNDIIMFDGTNWNVIFDSSTEEVNQYTQMIDGTHYRFTNQGWVYTYLGEYNPGYFRIVLGAC